MPPETHIWGPAFFDAFRSGEEHAFDRLFRAYHGPLTFYASRFTHDEEQAEDIVQDCFVELWARRGKLSGVQSIQSYLYRCVYNHCARWVEKKIRAEKAIHLLPEPEANQIIESELMASIQQAIDNLPERMKQVVQMHYLEDKSLKEIGQEIGIDPETARSHRYRAIQLLKKTIIPS